MTLQLLNKGHTIYMDNWYSSVRLYLYLLEKKTLASGTVRIERGLPQKIVTSQPPENSSSVSLIGDEIINATKYLSTKVVYMLSTCHGHEELAVSNRRRDGNIKHPKISAEYNKNMGGVDKTDQLLQPYDCGRKSMKWTKKIFHLVQMSLCNGFLLAKKDGYDKPLLNFIESVIMSWIFNGRTPQAPGQLMMKSGVLRGIFLHLFPPLKRRHTLAEYVWCATKEASAEKRQETTVRIVPQSLHYAIQIATGITIRGWSTGCDYLVSNCVH